MFILALDLGTKTGVAYGPAGARPRDIVCETWTMPSGGGDDVGPFAASFMQQLKGAFDAHPITHLVFEAPYIAGGYDKKRPPRPDVIRRFYGMAFACEGFAAARGVPCFEMIISTLKKNFAGHGRAEKADMIKAAERRGFIAHNEHEADACACWLEAVSHGQPQSAHLYDPVFVVRRDT